MANSRKGDSNGTDNDQKSIKTDTMTSRFCDTKTQLEELIMDITSHDLNRQMQQLISDYKKTGDEHSRIDAEYLRSEFSSWWNDDEAEFVSPYTHHNS